jgi:hypothetical protein
MEELREILEEGELTVTISYDAQASTSSKQKGLTLWLWQPPTSPMRNTGLLWIT